MDTIHPPPPDCKRALITTTLEFAICKICDRQHWRKEDYTDRAPLIHITACYRSRVKKVSGFIVDAAETRAENSRWPIGAA